MRITRALLRHNIQLTAEVGALTEWQREIHDRKRTVHDRDPLWVAAVAEANGRDYIAAGLIPAANECRAEAAATIVEAYVKEAACQSATD
jgi:hypothetical protein